MEALSPIGALELFRVKGVPLTNPLAGNYWQGR